MGSNGEKLAKLALQLASLCEKKSKIDLKIQSIKSQLEKIKSGDISVLKTSKQQKYEEEIVSILKDFGGKATSKKIQSKYSGKNCAVYLAKMVGDDKVSRIKHGVYALKDNNKGTIGVAQPLGEENNFNVD